MLLESKIQDLTAEISAQREEARAIKAMGYNDGGEGMGKVHELEKERDKLEAQLAELTKPKRGKKSTTEKKPTKPKKSKKGGSKHRKTRRA
jgi:hypothetical protein